MKKTAVVLWILGIAVWLSALLMFLFIKDKDALFWVSFSFLEFALVAAAVITLLVTVHTRLSFPIELSIVVLAGLYVVVVAAIDVVFGWLFRIAVGPFVCIHLIALAAFAIVCMVMLLLKRSITAQNQAANEAIYEQQALLGEVERLQFLAKKLPAEAGRQAERQFSQLHDAIRYSSTVSDRSAAEIDGRIRSSLFSLALEIENLIDIQSEDIAAIQAAVTDLRQLIQERDLQIKIGKIGI